MYIFEIEEGGFISSKNGHNDISGREISGMIAQLVPGVTSRITVLPQRYRLLILSSTRVHVTRLRIERTSCGGAVIEDEHVYVGKEDEHLQRET